MTAPFQPNVPYVQDGEPVDAAVTNRPVRVAAGNAQYAVDRLNAAETGEGSIAYNVTIDPALQVGAPAGFDPIAQSFVPALAELATDPISGALVPSPRSQCVGILINKASATSGDMLIAGRHAVDLTVSVGVNARPGLYYLSGSRPGGLTLQKPPVSAPILFYDGTYIYFSPTLRDFAEAHTHYAFDLYCASAGTDVVTSGRHTISAPNPALPGWLPAHHAVFNGTAPTGAVWGYNLAADAKLAAIWPPVPLSSLALWWDKGDGSDVGAQLVPGGANASLIAGLWYADRTTIWWLSDCTNSVPWPTAYNPASPPPPPTSVGTPPACPPPTTMRLVASFTEMLFATDKSAVTSIVPAAGSPITVVGCTGGPASTGCLQLGLNLAFLVGTTPVSGASVFKALSNSTFQVGNVVEMLTAGANVALTPSIGTAANAQGSVRIDVVTDLTGREIAPEVVRLDQAKERSTGNVLYLGFPAGRSTAIRMRFNVPAIGLPAGSAVTIRLLVLGTAAGTLPATSLSVMVLPRPTAGTPVTPPSSDTALTINTNVAINAGQYVECQSNAVIVNPEDTLFVTFTRAASDGYAGELGVIRASAVIA